MIHRLWMLLVGLCLFLFVATAALWVRSYLVCDSLEWNQPPIQGTQASDNRDIIVLGRGIVAFQTFRHQLGAIRDMHDLGHVVPTQRFQRAEFEWLTPKPAVNPAADWPTGFGWRFLGFGHIDLKDSDGLPSGAPPRRNYTFSATTVPLWPAALLFAVPPGLWLRSRSRKQNQPSAAPAVAA